MQLVWQLEVKRSRSIRSLFINFNLEKLPKRYFWKISLVAHGGYYYPCYTVGLTSWGQKVKEHNEFINLFYINCKNLLKLYILKIGLVAHGGYYYLCYAVGLTTWGLKVNEIKVNFIYLFQRLGMGFAKCQQILKILVLSVQRVINGVNANQF